MILVEWTKMKSLQEALCYNIFRKQSNMKTNIISKYKRLKNKVNNIQMMKNKTK